MFTLGTLGRLIADLDTREGNKFTDSTIKVLDYKTEEVLHEGAAKDTRYELLRRRVVMIGQRGGLPVYFLQEVGTGSKLLEDIKKAVQDQQPEIFINLEVFTKAAAAELNTFMNRSSYVADDDRRQQRTYKRRTLDGIKVEGHKGKWYITEGVLIGGKQYFLLESETYGEDAPWIAIDEDEKVILDDIANGADDLEYFLEQV